MMHQHGHWLQKRSVLNLLRFGSDTSLRKKLEVIEIVLDESTDPIFNILEDGTYRYVNNAFAAPFG